MSIWSAREAAKEMGISEQRVRKLLAEGRIKGRKMGGTWVVLRLGYKKKRGQSMSIYKVTLCIVDENDAAEEIVSFELTEEQFNNLGMTRNPQRGGVPNIVLMATVDGGAIVMRSYILDAT